MNIQASNYLLCDSNFGAILRDCKHFVKIKSISDQDA